jgi:polyisoprenoid-binding protein YceI
MTSVATHPGTTTTWKIDTTHSHVEFAVKHLMIATVKGRFADVQGTVEAGEDFSNPSIDVIIGAASIDTRQEQRDAHLRSADFFDVERFPTITFRSRRAAAGPDGALRVTGDITIHGVTKEVVLDVVPQGTVRDPWGGERAGFSASTKINRQDFGLTWNQVLETGGIAVGTDVRIAIDVELVKG